jgi:hypothetical protein
MQLARQHHRAGHPRGRKVSVKRPRGRTRDGQEIELDTWSVFSSEDLLTQLVCERMLAGVATRRHADVGESLGAEFDKRATATGRSSVSRRWKRATEAAMGELMARDLAELDQARVPRVLHQQVLRRPCDDERQSRGQRRAGLCSD